MTDKLKTAAEMALEALDWVVKDNDSYDPFNDRWDDVHNAISALRQALADTGIDRGAWSDVPDATQWVDELRGEEWTPDDMAHRPGGLSMDDLPPKREWIGLTYTDLQEINDSMRTLNSYDITDVYAAIEAKLREKNHAS